MKSIFVLTSILFFLLTSVFASLSIVVSIPPLGYAVKYIGGNLVNVEVLVRAGDNPHNYSLNPRQVMMISKATAFIDLGLAQDKWIAQRVEAVSPNMKVVDSTDGMTHLLIGTDGSYNPHVWLDVRLYELLCINIYNALVKLDPRSQKKFSYNLGDLLTKLNVLDEKIREKLKPFRGKPFVAQHPAWVYFARAYGLGKEYSLMNDSGQTVSPREYQKIIEIMKRYKINSIIGDPVTPAKIAHTLSEDTGAKIVEVNPIYTMNYFDLMKTVSEKFVEVLK